MKICGIVAEYNPFHNGHIYQIQKAREVTGADRIIVCMSGDFVQRGLPAIADKYSRTRAALLCGADLVVELPVDYATASAKGFAAGSVTILNAIGCDSICFGSESGDIEHLHSLANAYRSAELQYADEIKELVRSGLSYPKAISTILAGLTPVDTGSILSNDRLGIAYIDAINRYGLGIIPYTVKREGDYLDTDVNSGSAMAIRSAIETEKSFAGIRELMPNKAFDAIFGDEGSVVFADDFSDILYAKITSVIGDGDDIEDARKRLMSYADVSENLAAKIVACIGRYTSFCDFAELIHSPEYTMSRVYRALIHIVLNIHREIDTVSESDCYARVLGLKRETSDFLADVKKRSSIPIISKAADADRLLNDKQMESFRRDINAAEYYEYIISGKMKRERVSEMSKGNVYV